MPRAPCLRRFLVALLLTACQRNGSSPDAPAPPASQVRTNTSSPSPAPPAHAQAQDAGAGATRAERLFAPATPLTRFTLVPVGGGPVPAELKGIDARLRNRLQGYGFTVGGPEPTLAPPGMSCAELLRRVVPARGTILVLVSGQCEGTPFSELAGRMSVGAVALAPLRAPGRPAVDRLLDVVEGVSRELLGLQFPCRGGKECCAPHRAATVEELDRRAGAGCSSQGPALDRIREQSGLQ